MKLAIVGSRGITGIRLEDYIKELPSEIVSGGARGIDTLAADYARKNSITLTEFLPDYQKYGRCAPVIRNRQIIEAADKVLAIWNGKSRGTQNSISLAKRLGKEVSLFIVDTSDDEYIPIP